MSIRSEYQRRLFGLAKDAKWLSDEQINYCVAECKAWNFRNLIPYFKDEMLHRENMRGLTALDIIIDEVDRRTNRK